MYLRQIVFIRSLNMVFPSFTISSNLFTYIIKLKFSRIFYLFIIQLCVGQLSFSATSILLLHDGHFAVIRSVSRTGLISVRNSYA